MPDLVFLFCNRIVIVSPADCGYIGYKGGSVLITGLSTVKHGVQYYAAQVEPECEPGKGTRVSLIFGESPTQ